MRIVKSTKLNVSKFNMLTLLVVFLSVICLQACQQEIESPEGFQDKAIEGNADEICTSTRSMDVYSRTVERYQRSTLNYFENLGTSLEERCAQLDHFVSVNENNLDRFTLRDSSSNYVHCRALGVRDGIQQALDEAQEMCGVTPDDDATDDDTTDDDTLDDSDADEICTDGSSLDTYEATSSRYRRTILNFFENLGTSLDARCANVDDLISSSESILSRITVSEYTSNYARCRALGIREGVQQALSEIEEMCP